MGKINFLGSSWKFIYFNPSISEFINFSENCVLNKLKIIFWLALVTDSAFSFPLYWLQKAVGQFFQTYLQQWLDPNIPRNPNAEPRLS